MATAAAPKSATAAQVKAWKRRMEYSNAEAAAELGVDPRTFSRWLAGDSVSPRWLGERFRTEGLR